MISLKKRILSILLALWMAFIFSMSSQNSEISSNTSGGTIRIVLSFVPKFAEQSEEVQEHIIENLQFIVRKSAHFIAYMILGIILILLLLQFNSINKKPQVALALCVFYAISDEFHQFFVPGRACQLRDVLIDSMGSLTGILLVLLCLKIFKAKKSLKN